MSFLETIRRAKSYLEEQGRVSLRALKREFQLDDDALDELVEELVDVQQVATREGKVVAWVGPTSAGTPAAPAAPEAEIPPTSTAPAGEPTAPAATATAEPEMPVATAAAETPTPAPDEGERRQLTVMFCDLVGSTELSQRLDAEDLRTVVRAYQESAASVIERYAGHIAQYLGDGLLVYFGYPQAHEDAAERAVRAGREILTALGSLNDTLEREHGLRLAARVGIHTGPVVVGTMGGGAKSETLALGDTTNIAARIEGTAEPDSVVISGATLRLVAGMFVVEDRGPQTLKGVREPVTLYRVVQPSGVRSRLEVAAGRLTRFIGREVELATLVDRWERAQDGEGQTAVVLGEAGVGKSRLVYQLHEHLQAVPHTWLECGATPYTEGTPFHPMIELTMQGLVFTPDDTPAEKLAKLEGGLDTLASAETVALVADFLGLPPPTPLQLSPDVQRRKTIDLLVQWILSLSAAQPLVLVVEDLHWCDFSTLEMLGHLIAQSPTARVLLVATARPEFTTPWPARSNLTTVQVARLTKRHARDMITTLAGAELPADTVDVLVARADGVPLYLEELTKTVMDPGAARRVEDIPASLADSLMARLDRLSGAKEVAQRAAVLGREFGYPLLAATTEMDEAALRKGLERLAGAEILFARGEPPAATYTFKHALIQETAYQSLLKRTRQQLHARVAQVLEERFPERAASEPEVVARHYDQAGLVEPAVTHYQRAGERATQRSANEEAIGRLRRALDLVATLPETRERHRTELRLQMAIGAPLMAARGWAHPENAQTYTRARELASRVGGSPEVARVLAGLAAALSIRGEFATSLEVAREALQAAERTGAAFDLVSAHEEVGVSLLFQGQFSLALHHFEQSIASYDPSEHGPLAYAAGQDRGVFSHSLAGWCHASLGRPNRALALSEEGVVVARRVEHPFSLAQALGSSGVVLFERREVDRLRERYEELLVLSERLGFPFWVAFGRVARGWARVESGDGAASIEEMQQALAQLDEIESQVCMPMLLCWHAGSLQKVGRHDEALGALEQGFTRAEAAGQHYYDAELHRLHAEVRLDMDGNAVGEPEALLRHSMEIAQRQEAKTFELRAAISLARLWQRQGKRAAARDLLQPVYDWFTEGAGTQDLKDAKALLEELA